MGMRAKQISKISEEKFVESVPDTSILDQKRIIFNRSMNWTLECHYFSLQGEELAHMFERRYTKEKWWKPPLELLGLRMYLPVEYQFKIVHDQTYTLKKAGGWSKPLVLYSEDGQEVGRYEQMWKEITKLNFHMYNRSGDHVATMNGGMSGVEFMINSVDEMQWGYMRIGGVPVEAMEVFQDGGDIFDINTELDQESRLLTIAAPIAIHTYYKIKM